MSVCHLEMVRRANQNRRHLLNGFLLISVTCGHEQNLLKLEPGTLMQQRVAKFRKMGAVEENVEVDPHIKRNMKKREVPLESDEPKLLLAGNEQPIDFKNKNSLPVNASANNSTRE